MKVKSNFWIHKIAWVLFIIYIAVLFYFLFFSERYGRTSISADYRYNLELFKEIKRFITYRDEVGLESFFVNIVGNVLAFSPFGFVLPIISPINGKFFKVVLLSLELAIIIECVQLVFKVGIFDVDDIFMNTIGAVIGYIGYLICHRMWKRR